MKSDITENDMIVFLQTNGAKFDKQFRQWMYPGVRGYMSTFQMYRFLKNKVDKK